MFFFFFVDMMRCSSSPLIYYILSMIWSRAHKVWIYDRQGARRLLLYIHIYIYMLLALMQRDCNKSKSALQTYFTTQRAETMQNGICQETHTKAATHIYIYIYVHSLQYKLCIYIVGYDACVWLCVFVMCIYGCAFETTCLRPINKTQRVSSRLAAITSYIYIYIHTENRPEDQKSRYRTQNLA